MLLKSSFITIIILAAAAVSFPQTAKPRKPVNKEALITSLTTSKELPLIFGDDGVLSNTLIERDDSMPREVRRIINLGPEAIPLLISHLDDTRLVKMAYYGNGGEDDVTVADVALDILGAIVKNEAPMFDAECARGQETGDTPGDYDCKEVAYSFWPPSFKYIRGKRVPSKEMITAKRNWQKALASKKVRYEKYKY